MHGRRDCEAFTVGIKEKAALQWEHRVETALSRACDR